MSWFNADGLLLKYGQEKVVPTKAGEYKTFGPLREIEVKIDISTLTTSSQILSDQVYFEKGVFLEEVQIEVQTAVATITSLSVGLYQSNDRSTAIDETAFIAAQTTSGLNTAGNKITYVKGTSLGGTQLGLVPIASNAAFSGLISAKIAGSAGTGVVIVRIRYRPVQ